MDGQWEDLSNRGFLRIPAFLSPAECEVLRRDYETPTAATAANGNYNLKLAPPELLSKFEPKLEHVSNQISINTDIVADVTSGGMYFATERGINFSWHQDHESYFMYQEHYHYLNFYIPFIKPVRHQTNVSVVPFDRLRAAAPAHYRALVGGGATEFEIDGDRTIATNNEDDSRLVLPINLDMIAETPELNPGDLLLFRGDVIHRTQDVDTERVSLSIRRQSSRTLVDRRRLLAGGPTKRSMIWANHSIYRLMFQKFSEAGRERLSVGEINAYLNSAWTG